MTRSDFFLCLMPNYIRLQAQSGAESLMQAKSSKQARSALTIPAKLIFASDFSGWGPEIQVCSNLGWLDGVRFKAASEADPKTRAVNLFVHKTLVGKSGGSCMSEDMMTRDALKPGTISFYLAGPPCPSFCPGGAGAGLSDERGRLMLKTVERVLAEQPLTFALENSGALLEKKYITMTNQILRGFQAAGYKVKARKIDTQQP